ncbi:PQQ-binding-like beta-propeller repeat protein [Natronococcus sp. JC468]|uniref:outer membrane protein assembly factor BamB family protein n=1 Tax=Natronococcus sp. JC468 TaxID=1961921 RepID=UPI001438C94E|nr:PQQ-binding-like beta-propeller repeat protein [Natronococcus sp. JC468]NKE35234.1 PQQ-binding-like beta-propeller repeat protein [Natronococcus sp. JC468]
MAERRRTVERPLGEIDPAGSRQLWTRSSVELTDDLVVTGRWNGTVTAFDRESLAPRWEVDEPERAVSLAVADGALVVGERGENGTVAAYSLESGTRRWSLDTAADVGAPATDRLFALPYVLSLATDDDGRVYAATRRYERDGEDRRWHGAVYGLDRDGTVRWRYETDASPTALSLDDERDRLAVGYNRCPGAHDRGVVVLDSRTGEPDWTWDSGTDGDRRVGDVSFAGGRLAVASHGDKRGYVLEADGTERWGVDLAVETDIDGETLYAYPNHACANDGHVAFVTGSTYAVGRRETASRHPNEHRIVAFGVNGDPQWDAPVRGFVRELATRDGAVVAPCAQNFRVRNPETHALRWFDLETGESGERPLEGIATAAAVDDERIVAIEEPVAYHDEGRVRGEYALIVEPRFT